MLRKDILESSKQPGGTADPAEAAHFARYAEEWWNPDGVFKTALMAAMLAIFPGSVMVFIYRSQRKQIAELDNLLNSVIETDWQPAVPRNELLV